MGAIWDIHQQQEVVYFYVTCMVKLGKFMVITFNNSFLLNTSSPSLGVGDPACNHLVLRSMFLDKRPCTNLPKCLQIHHYLKNGIKFTPSSYKALQHHDNKAVHIPTDDWTLTEFISVEGVNFLSPILTDAKRHIGELFMSTFFPFLLWPVCLDLLSKI